MRISSTKTHCIVASVYLVGCAGRCCASDSPTELEPLFERWQNLPPMKVIVQSRSVSHVVPINQDPWDPANWTKTPAAQIDREVTARLSPHGYLVYVDSTTSSSGKPVTEWMSLLNEECILLSDPRSSNPRALITDEITASTLLVDCFLTVLEKQFFSERRDWADVLTHYRCSIEKTERVDERDCLKFVNMAETESCRIEIWVAPDLGFAPVRAKQTNLAVGDPPPSSEMRVRDLQPVGSTWIAKSAVIIVSNPKVAQYSQVHEYDVRELEIGAENRPRSLRELFASGTVVQDLRRGEEWRVNGFGRKSDAKPIDMQQRERTKLAVAADIERADVQKSRNYGIAGVIAATLVIVGGLIWLKHRRML